MSVDGNFVVLIHKQLLCLVLRRGVLRGFSTTPPEGMSFARPVSDLSLLTVGEDPRESGARTDDDSGRGCEEE